MIAAMVLPEPATNAIISSMLPKIRARVFLEKPFEIRIVSGVKVSVMAMSAARIP